MARQTKKHRGVYEHPRRPGVWCIHYFDQFGRRHREVVGMKQAAITAYQQRKTEVRQYKFTPDDVRRQFADVAEIIDDRLDAAKCLRSFDDEKQRLLWWKTRLGDRSARSIMSSDIEKARQDLTEGRSVATVNRYLTVFKTAYSLAVRNRKADRNPVREVKLLKENNQRVRYLSHEEEKRLFKKISPVYRPLVLLALHTGMRKSEQLSLRWEDVDFRQRIITVRESKSGEPRRIPMNDVACHVLKKLPRRIDNSHVFPGKCPGERMTDLPKDWEVWLKEAKIEDFRWHDLRHTFASRLVTAGINLYSVSQLLGHHSLEMTQRYAHLAPDYLQGAVNSLVSSKTEQPSKQPPKEKRASQAS